MQAGIVVGCLDLSICNSFGKIIIPVTIVIVIVIGVFLVGKGDPR